MSFTPVYSYIESIYLWTKDTQKILVLGDNHTPCTADARDKQLITVLLEQCAESPIKTKILLEHIPQIQYLMRDKDRALFTKYTHEEYMLLIGYLSQYAFEHHNTYASLTFCQSDIRYNPALRLLNATRTAVVQYLNTIHYLENNILSQPFAMQEKIKLYCLIESALEQDNFHGSQDSTYQELYSTFETILAYSDSTQSSSSNLEFKQFIARQSQKVREFYYQLKAFNTTYQATSVLTSIKRKIFESTSISDIREFSNLYMPLLNEIPELGFIKELLDNLRQYTSLIVFTGSAHSNALNQTLKATGFTCTHLLTHLSQDFNSASQEALWDIFQAFIK